METLTVGVVGHIDHGKTTLLQKLTGVWASRHSQELKRGITIKLGYSDVVLKKNGKEYSIKEGEPVKHISFVDAPGHEMLMATMLSGAAMIDAAVLVVAANEGIKPQTREHVMALQAKRIKQVVVVQNKIDLVSKEQAMKNYHDIINFLKGKYENINVIPVSAQQEVNIDKVFEALAEFKIDKSRASGQSVFLVARSFDVNKPGTKPDQLHGAVLGGTLVSGVVKIGDSIEIKPGIPVKEANQVSYKPLVANILNLFNGSQKVKELMPGGSTSIETDLDMSLAKSDALAGCVAGLKGSLPEPANVLKLKYTLFPEVFGLSGDIKVEQLKASELLLLSINTSMTVGMIKKLGKGDMEVNLKLPAVFFKGDNVALSRNMGNHWRLIGYGEII